MLHILIMSLIVGIPIPSCMLASWAWNPNKPYVTPLEFITALLVLLSYIAAVPVLIKMILLAFTSIYTIIILVLIVGIGIIVTTFTSKQFVKYLKSQNEDLTEVFNIFIYINFVIFSIFSPFIIIPIYIIKHIFVNNIFYRIYVNAMTEKENNDD